MFSLNYLFISLWALVSCQVVGPGTGALMGLEENDIVVNSFIDYSQQKCRNLLFTSIIFE